MSLGGPCTGGERYAKCGRSRRLAIWCVGLVGLAIMASCGATSPGAVSAQDAVKRAATVPPTTPGWNWPKVPTSSYPYSKDEGAGSLPTGDKLAAKLYRRLHGLDLVGSAGSRWEDPSKLSHVGVELWSSRADAHSAMPAYREFAHGWARKTGVVSDEAVRGLGDEGWRMLARGHTEEVTYKWRRGNLVFEAHIQCFTVCPSNIDEAARAWVDTIDDEAQRPNP